MPPLIREYNKTSFVFLLVGLLIGVVLDAYGRYARLLITARAHLLLVGFMPMMVT